MGHVVLYNYIPELCVRERERKKKEKKKEIVIHCSPACHHHQRRYRSSNLQELEKCINKLQVTSLANYVFIVCMVIRKQEESDAG